MEVKNTMPGNRFQRMVLALITVVITVHTFVLYNAYVVNADALMMGIGTDNVFDAIGSQGGLYMFGTILPIGRSPWWNSSVHT